MLTHPNAPPEKRMVTIAAGETIALDVVMKVGTPEGDAGLDGSARAMAGEARRNGDGGE
jgi:hypothetical protein